MIQSLHAMTTACHRLAALNESLRAWTAVHWRLLHRYRRAARRAAHRHDYAAAHRLQQRAQAHHVALMTLLRIRREQRELR